MLNSVKVLTQVSHRNIFFITLRYEKESLYHSATMWHILIGVPRCGGDYLGGG